MTVSAINLILCMLVMLVVPLFFGSGLCGMLHMKRTIAKSFAVGYIGLWAVCQFLSVPLILLKQSFILLVVLYTVVIAGVCGYGIYAGYHKTMLPGRKNVAEIAVISVMLCAIVYIMVQAVRLQLPNDDDSRFVVNAVDIVRTNRLLLTDVNTGKELYTWTGDLFKDVISPWPVFTAYLSKMTGVPVATMMHTILPPVLLLLMCCIYWLLAGEFFAGKTIYKSMFVCFMILLNVYGYYSIYSAETFTMIRLWQGKAVLAGVGIPAMLLAFLWIYNEVDGAYVYLLVTVLGLAILSSMSFILTTIMLGCFGLVYGIAKRSIRTSLLIWSTCFVNVIYLGISWMINR